MSVDRVRYFSPKDGCYGYMLDRIESIDVPDYEDIDINDAIEYEQINRYFNKGIPAKLRQIWTDEQFKEYSEKSKLLFNMANRFFSDLNDENIFDKYCQVDSFYETVFWEIFDSRKLFDRFSPEVFEKVLQYHEDAILTVLTYSKIVKKYGELLRKYILNHLSCIDLLLQYCEQDASDNSNNKKIYLPEEFSGEDILEFFDRYLDSEQVNPNYAAAIFLMQNNNKIRISDELRLKANRRYQQEWEKMSASDSSNTFSRQTKLIFEPDQDQEDIVIFYQENNCYIYSYSEKWFLETLDYPSILNNFIYVFKFVDYFQTRSLHTFNALESLIFERINQTNSQYCYPENFSFHLKNDLAEMQMESYYKFLLKHKIRYENVLEWFFTEYLQKEFDCPKICLSMPSKDSIVREKCEIACDAMEIVIKQFSQYAEKHKIDFELLSISSGPIKFNQIPSLLNTKYLYGLGKDFKNWSYLLLSDQCSLIYNNITNDNFRHSCFLDLLIKESVYKKDYSENEQSCIDQLVNADLIKIAEDGKIQIGNEIKLTVLRDLNDNGVISRWDYPKSAQPIFQEWISNGVLTEGRSLLSQQEADYFSYFLNREKYTNGLDIRNKYSHGIGQILNDDEHQRNYNILLRLMTILAIKINDDFWLYNKMQKEQKVRTILQK